MTPNGEADSSQLLSACPVPRQERERILLGHGSGGKLSAELIRNIFLPAFHNQTLDALEDQAQLDIPRELVTSRGGRLAMTTDAYVVRPLFFPGGDIGSLAINGTINDLVVGGATPQWISAAFILEEGLEIETLRQVCISMQNACDAACVQIVTGDTKVVERGHGDQIFITTTGLGIIPPGRCLSIRNAQPGDKILVSGTIGDHGIAIMSVREGLQFETVLQSDTAGLHELVAAMLTTSSAIRAMRDPTRGGLASSLNELAAASNVGIRINERYLPIRPEVQAACELLGLDPLYVANEGKLIAVVEASDADGVLSAMQQHPLGRNAAVIGEVTLEHPGMVVMRSSIGGERLVQMMSGEQLPRIC